VETLRTQIKTNKVFLYMVIHDLKHPTESMISQLESLFKQLERHVTIMEALTEQTNQMRILISEAREIKDNA